MPWDGGGSEKHKLSLFWTSNAKIYPPSLLPLLLQIRVSKILWTFWVYKMKFIKRLLWKRIKSPTSFLSLEVAEGRELLPWALGDYNVVRLRYLCGSLTSLKDNSKRSSKDMLSSGRISQGITLNDSFPLDSCKKLITFHMQIDTPQVYCLASFFYSNCISELLPSVPRYVKCHGPYSKHGPVLLTLPSSGRS